VDRTWISGRSAEDRRHEQGQSAGESGGGNRIADISLRACGERERNCFFFLQRSAVVLKSCHLAALGQATGLVLHVECGQTGSWVCELPTPGPQSLLLFCVLLFL
jgi:hypothetical protein